MLRRTIDMRSSTALVMNPGQPFRIPQSVVFVVDDDVFGARVAGGADSLPGVAPGGLSVCRGIPRPPRLIGSELPDT